MCVCVVPPDSRWDGETPFQGRPALLHPACVVGQAVAGRKKEESSRWLSHKNTPSSTGAPDVAVAALITECAQSSIKRWAPGTGAQERLRMPYAEPARTGFRHSRKTQTCSTGWDGWASARCRVSLERPLCKCGKHGKCENVIFSPFATGCHPRWLGAFVRIVDASQCRAAGMESEGRRRKADNMGRGRA